MPSAIEIASIYNNLTKPWSSGTFGAPGTTTVAFVIIMDYACYSCVYTRLEYAYFCVPYYREVSILSYPLIK